MKIKIDKLSKLSRGKYGTVCNYKNKFINFDELKGILHYPQSPKTPDMLYICKDRKEIWFVEFKSNKKDNLKSLKFEVKRKILDGIIVFYELFKDRFCEFNKNYIVVYRDFDNPELEVLSYFSEELIESYDLKELENKFLKTTNVLNCVEFKELFLARFGVAFKK